MISSTKKASTTKKISIMDHPEYRQEWDRLMALRGRLSEAEKDINDIRGRYRQMPERLEAARAEALELVIQGGEPQAADFQKKLREDLEAAQSRRRSLTEAEYEQDRRVNELRLKVSAEICKELKPRDVELAHADAMLFIKWCEQRIQHIDFLNALEAGNISFSHYFIPMGNRYGDPRDPNSNAALLLQEYHARGYLKADEIPKEWRDAWHKFAGMTLRTVAV